MKVKELLSDASKWTKCATAKDKDGCEVSADDKSAICFCLLGAVTRCYPSFSERDEIYRRIKGSVPCPYVSYWNDSPERTFEEVKALVEKLDI